MDPVHSFYIIGILLEFLLCKKCGDAQLAVCRLAKQCDQVGAFEAFVIKLFRIARAGAYCAHFLEKSESISG